jgi:beta-glucosidase/6-phospho-beta-glucosidase/beta-galactosidase
VHKRYGLPIYVTENGTAYPDQPTPDGEVSDEPRISYLEAYTDAMFDAIADGVDVRGYFVWSLLDNFAWGSGYSQRLRAGLYGLPDAAPAAEGVIPLVRRTDQGAFDFVRSDCLT